MRGGEDEEEPIILVVDASGLTVSKKGYYIEEKLHIAVDAKSNKVVSFRITNGNVHGTKKKLRPRWLEYHVCKKH